jgi:hypothetical protein
LLAQGGENGGTFATPLYGTVRSSLAPYANAAIIEYGTNDFANTGTTLASFEANVISIWKTLRADGVQVIYETTLTPRTTSTDTWTTLAGQGPFAPATSNGPGCYRTGYNDWLRDGAPMTSGGAALPAGTTSAVVRAGQTGSPLTGVFDITPFVESSTDSAIWAVNGTINYLTTDGIHPTATAHQRMKTAINTAALVPPARTTPTPPVGGTPPPTNPVTTTPSGSGPTLLDALSNSPAPIVYSVLSGPATISNQVLNITGVGMVTVQASQAAFANYGASSKQTSFTVAKGVQTISFTAPPSTATVGQPPITLSATASTGLPITFMVLDGPATVNGNQLTVTGAGSVTVSAQQLGTANYYASSRVNYNIKVIAAP